MAIADWFKENKEIVVSGMAFGTLLGLWISGTEGVSDESEWGIEADPVDDVFEEEDPFEFEEESSRTQAPCDAQEHALNMLCDYRTGAEIQELSNPGDYPYDPSDDPEFEIIEVDD